MSALVHPRRTRQAADAHTLRSYRPGDEPQIVKLWNDHYAGYAGLSTRTVEYWRWSILERPGLSPQDVLLVEFHRVGDL